VEGRIPHEVSGSALAEALDRAVENRRDAAVELLRGLVRVPSVTGEEGAIAPVVEGAFRERGLAVDRWEATPEEVAPYLEHVGEQARYWGRPNVVGLRSGVGGGRSLLLNAHVDTVGAGDPEAWTHPPHSGAVEGDLLYGRGACDMKGGLVTHLIALDALRSAGVRLLGDVKVAATVGEEDGGLGTVSAILRGHTADAALITEPTDLALVVAQGGSVMFRITVQGRSTHAATRGAGVSAFAKFVPIHEALVELERERNEALSHPLYDHLENKVPVNIGVVRSGDWASTVPELLVAEGRFGLLPGEELEDVKALVRERVLSTAGRDPWLREHPPRVEWFGGQFAASEVPADAPVALALARAHKSVAGKEPAVEGVTWGADMRHFVHLGGMPCVMYGAGDVSHAHGPDERIGITDLLTASKTVARLLADWCGLAG
jgi:acetylornithine deacetylase